MESPNINEAAKDAVTEDYAPGVFAAADLAALKARDGAPMEFVNAVRLLVDFCLDPKDIYGCENENPSFGRFAFFDYEATAHQTRALFRMARAALELLEADYLSCEASEIAHYRKTLSAFEQLQREGASTKSAEVAA